MRTIALLMGLAFGTQADAPECRNPPSRASDSYWAFIEACGCANLDPPSRTSRDYERFLKACSQWRQRNPHINVIIPDTPTANSTRPTDQTGPADPTECRNSPARTSDSYWAFIEACGCASLDPPSKTSQDYERFLKACSQWRQRNPQIKLIVPSTPPANSTRPDDPTSPTPTPSPNAKPKDQR
jgi:hypothetical protein